MTVTDGVLVAVLAACNLVIFACGFMAGALVVMRKAKK